MKKSHMVAWTLAVTMITTLIGYFFFHNADIGVSGSISVFLMFWLWFWFATTEQVDEANAEFDRRHAATRRQRFSEYIAGEHQLMRDWEDAFGTPGAAIWDRGIPELRIEPGANNKRVVIPEVVSEYERRNEHPSEWRNRSVRRVNGFTWEDQARCHGFNVDMGYEAYQAWTQMVRRHGDPEELEITNQQCRMHWEGKHRLTQDWQKEARCIGFEINPSYRYEQYMESLGIIRQHPEGRRLLDAKLRQCRAA